jgi:DNA polymerase-3 subunit beta
MTITIDRARLAEAISRVQRIVEKRNTIPILSNLLLRAEGGRLRLTATDLDMWATTEVEAVVEAPVVTTVPAAIFAAGAGKMPDGDVRIAVDKDGAAIKVTAGRARMSVHILPATDFPDPPAEDFPVSFRLPAATLVRLLSKTSIAMSDEATRYYLNGAYLHVHAGQDGLSLRVVATDGHRLVRADAPLPDGAEGMEGVIIPSRTVHEMIRLAKDAGEVEIAVSTAKIRMTAGDTVLVSKLIDGTFPDYHRVIPRDQRLHMTVPSDGLAAAIGRATVVAAHKLRAARFDLVDDLLSVTVVNADAGEATAEVDVSTTAEAGAGTAITIGFNTGYVLSLLDVIGPGPVVFRMSDPGGAAVLEPAEPRPAGCGELAVIMPMRV